MEELFELKALLTEGNISAEHFQKPVSNLAQEIIHRYLNGDLIEKT